MELPSFIRNFKLKDALSMLQRESRFLGVDIGSSSIKIAQLRKEKERAVLETYGELSLAGYSKSEDGQAVRLIETTLAEALKDVMAEAQASAKKAVVSIPLKESFLTTMEMPYLSEADLAEAIPFEARKYVPIPLSETKLDWWILPPSSRDSSKASIGSGKRKFVNVLLAAVPRDIFEKYNSILKKVGLEAAAFEIEVFSFVRSSLKYDLGASLMLDMGASSTKMIIADSGVARSSHSLDRGSQELTLSLAQSLGLEFGRAEILKRETGMIKHPETEGIVSVLEPMVDYILAEGERFLLDWKRRGGRPISKVFLAGGGSMLKGIGDLAVKKFGVEVEISNPFRKVVYPAFLEPALKEIGPSFHNAVGLALREF